MVYDDISLFPSYGYKFITPIELKNESKRVYPVYPIIGEKITEYEGIKLCYRILIYNSSFNIHFESVSILGHKFGYVYPLYHQQLKDSISSIIEQFESYTRDNIINNLSYFKYDINNIKLFTNDTYEGMKLYQESLIARNILCGERVSEEYERNELIQESLKAKYISNIINDRIEEKKLKDDINRINGQVENLISELETFKNKGSVISENNSREEFETTDVHIIPHNKTTKHGIPKVDDINNIDENLKKMLYVGFIIYSVKSNSKYVYQGDNKWKLLKKANKDKLLNVNREKTWKRI